MSSESDDEIVAGGSGIGTRRQLRRRAAAAGAGTGAGRRLRDEDTEEDSGSEIEQARRKKGKKIPLPEEDEPGPSGMAKQVRWFRGEDSGFFVCKHGILFLGSCFSSFYFLLLVCFNLGTLLLLLCSTPRKENVG